MKIIFWTKGNPREVEKLIGEIETELKRKLKVLKFLIKTNFKLEDDYILIYFDIKGMGLSPMFLAKKQLKSLVDSFKKVLESRGIEYVKHEIE